MAQILILVWLIGVLWRVWRMARFLQLEGYDNARFLRWWVGKLSRYLLWRSLVFTGAAFFITLGLSIADQDTRLVFLAIWGIASILAIWPEPIKEVKQKFKLTQRAARLLVTAVALAVIVLIGLQVFLVNVLNLSLITRFSVISGIGLAVYLLCPLILPLANIVMYPVEASFRRVFVNKARQTLQQANPTVIGITGSYGKTSTKEYLAHILNARYRVLATPKSYNTLMGVCIVINDELQNDYGYDYFIVEMGAYVEGEIRRICALTQPQISVVTAVGAQHLERFGSIEKTAKAKYEIIEALPQDGVGIFNWDNPYVRAMYERGFPDTRIAVSWDNAAHATQLRFLARDLKETVNGMEFEVVDTLSHESHRFTTKLVGRHNVTNILLAAAVARHLGMSLVEIAMRVATLEPAEHRLQRKTLAGGITVIDDAYSANPVGAQNALDVLALYQKGRRVLITPGIVELGSLHEQENRKLGQRAAQVCTDIVLVGIEQTAPIQRGIQDIGFDADHLHIFDTREETIAWFQRELKAGDTVLFLNDLPDTYL